MAHIVQRKNRFYVVAYDGIDPLTGRERRRWHTAGDRRGDAEALALRLESTPSRSPGRPVRSPKLEAFLSDTWLPRKRVYVRATTAYRYSWIVHKYLIPRLGDISLTALRAEHLDGLYEHLLAAGGRSGRALSPKTVHEAHLIIRNALDLAVHRRLIDHNVALAVHSPRRRGGGDVVARIWSVEELAAFLADARAHRLYPALHLAAHTGMRRGEIVGLKWSDIDMHAGRLSISRTLQTVGGKPTEFGAKTRSSRRRVELDDDLQLTGYRTALTIGCSATPRAATSTPSR